MSCCFKTSNDKKTNNNALKKVFKKNAEIATS